MAKYPASQWAPTALFKGRSSLLALGRSNEAWEWGGKLLTQFPDSAEAALLNETEDN